MIALKHGVSEYRMRLTQVLFPLVLCLTAAIPVSSQGQIVLNEIRSDGGNEWTVEIKNLGGSTVNVGGYFLCNYPSYSPLLSLSVDCGSLLLESGALVVVSGFEGGTAADGEMGLYINGAFSNPASIIDYVEWGSSGHQRSSVAQAAGIWTAMDFVAGFSEGNSIEYSGSGNTSASWEIEAIVQSLCAENPPGENCTLTPGSLSTGDPTSVCSGDGLPDLIDVTVNGAMGDNSFWMITDTSGLILDVLSVPPFDFEGEDEGICRIWHVVYNGEISGAEAGMDLSDLSGCLETSNAIEVVKRVIAGGSIATADPTTICAGDTIPDPIDVNLTDPIGDQSAWVITDEAGSILSLPAGPPFDFNDAGPGISRIRHLSYNDGLTGLAMGNNIDDLNGCFDLSDFIEVIHNEPDGGIIGTADPEACIVEADQDTILFSLTDDRGSFSSWIVTDTNFVITDLQAGPAFTFSGEAGVCLIWHISYETGLTGLSIGESALELFGCFDLSNTVAVIKRKPESGTISTIDNTIFCIGQGAGDTVEVELSGASGANQQYVIIDPDGDIAGLPGSNVISFDSYAAGLYEIVHISYADGLSGLVAGQPFDGLEGCFSVSNGIPVERNLVIGGAINTSDETMLCLLGSAVDTIHFQLAGAIGAASAWVVADTFGTILELPEGPDISFSSSDGTCLVRHISYVDGLSGLSVGGNIADLSGCFDLSNAVTIVKNRPDGGMISTAGPTTFCNGEGADSIDVNLSGAIGANGQWMIVTIGGTILDLPDGPPFDLSGYAAGTYVIFHLSYGDGLTGLQVGNTTGDLSGCWEISNPIVLQLQQPDGGEITSLSDTIQCAPLGVANPLFFNLADDEAPNSLWLITDSAQTILDTSNTEMIRRPVFPGDAPLLIWHAGYAGTLTGFDPGNTLNDLAGCYDLSNPIAVYPILLEVGEISLNSSTSFCTEDSSRFVDVSIAELNGPNTGWMITGAGNTIVELPESPPFDFSIYDQGQYAIWPIAYADDVTGLEIGLDASSLGGCIWMGFEPVHVYINPAPVAGSIATADTITALDFCSGDGMADTVRFTVSGDTSMNSAWLITRSDGRIEGVTESALIDFEGLGDGSCFVRHIAYQDGLSGLEAIIFLDDLLGCFQLSNAIEVSCRRVDGGTISTDDATEVCIGDGSPDLVDVDLAGHIGENYAWIVTDDTGLIESLPAAVPIDFEAGSAGTSLIYHLAYEIGLTGLTEGMNINGLAGCFNLSDPIAVLKADSGPVCTNVGVQDLPADLLRFDLYPNPATDLLRMEAVFVERRENIRVAVYSSIGVLQFERSYSPGISVSDDLAVRHLEAGNYFLRITVDGVHVTRAFLKL